MSAATRAPKLNLTGSLWRHARNDPERPALKIAGQTLSYGDVARRAGQLGALLKLNGLVPGNMVGILAGRSAEAYEALLGTLWAGCAYVPISLKFPPERILSILELCGLSALIVDAAGAKILSERVLAAAPDLIVFAGASTLSIKHSGARQKVVSLDRADDGVEASTPAGVGAASPAYVMFTSGTTGVPKGVIQSMGSVSHFLGVMQERFGFSAVDRVAQPAELNFDLSVFNMFMAWNAGATLHAVPSHDVMAPGKFIRENEISAWLSVPSVIGVMKRVGGLQPGSMLSLRYSLFCGEPLQVSAVEAWRAAAPNSIVENLYGPTEAIISHHERVSAQPVVTPEREIVSIGTPLRGLKACIVDSDRHIVPRGQSGEIAVAGPQLATGYLGMPELTRDRFPIIDGIRWYLTGDIGYEDTSGTFHYLGRVDNQVKVRGYRVELEEVEAHLRRVAETEIVAAVAWPRSAEGADGIIGFVASQHVSSADIRNRLKEWLPSYMVPLSIICLDALPLTTNRKVDRKALISMLSEGPATP